MKSATDAAENFGWWDTVRAFYFLLDTKRKSYTLNTVVLVLILFYDFVPVALVGKIIDFFTTYSIGDSLQIFYAYVAALTLSWAIVALIRLSVKKNLSSIQSEVTYFTRVRGFEKLLDFSVKWHDTENTGNKVQRIQAGADVLRQTQKMLSTDVFAHLTSIIGVVIAFSYLDISFLLAAIVYMAIFAWIHISFYHRTVQLNNENNISLEKAGGTYYEGLSNILTIKTLGVKEDFKTQVESKEAVTKENSLRRISLGNNKWKLFQVVNGLAVGLILFLAGNSFVAGTISLGTIFIVYNYFQKLNNAVTQSNDLIDSFINTKVSIGRMMPIFWDNASANQGTTEFPSSWDSISINHATFKYENKSESLEKAEIKDRGINDLSIKIQKYEKIGVVGKSGSGKSTFAKILLGLYPFDAGEFKIGNVNFQDIKHDFITKEVALVLQDSEMFNLTLKENITLMRTFDVNLFKKAISITQLQDVIEKLPDGVDTLIGEKGYRLSGGERQRIGIARAIYKDPQILVLDEATSSLDSKTEMLIQVGLEEQLSKKTIISIAHRVSTLKNVDRVIVFNEGKIIEEGTFKDLSSNKNSKFFEISHSSPTT